MVALSRFFSRFSWDVVGFSASTICAIHCAIVPLVILYTSMAGNDLVHNHTVENIILIFSATVGAISLFPAYRKHHQRLGPIAIFLFGIGGIILSRFHWPLLTESLQTTGGAITVATAHFINWRLCRPFHLGSRSSLR